jgi:hypothetical protein
MARGDHRSARTSESSMLATAIGKWGQKAQMALGVKMTTASIAFGDATRRQLLRLPAFLHNPILNKCLWHHRNVQSRVDVSGHLFLTYLVVKNFTAGIISRKE